MGKLILMRGRRDRSAATRPPSPADRLAGSSRRHSPAPPRAGGSSDRPATNSWPPPVCSTVNGGALPAGPARRRARVGRGRLRSAARRWPSRRSVLNAVGRAGGGRRQRPRRSAAAGTVSGTRRQCDLAHGRARQRPRSRTGGGRHWDRQCRALGHAGRGGLALAGTAATATNAAAALGRGHGKALALAATVNAAANVAASVTRRDAHAGGSVNGRSLANLRSRTPWREAPGDWPMSRSCNRTGSHGRSAVNVSALNGTGGPAGKVVNVSVLNRTGTSGRSAVNVTALNGSAGGTGKLVNVAVLNGRGSHGGGHGGGGNGGLGLPNESSSSTASSAVRTERR